MRTGTERLRSGYIPERLHKDLKYKNSKTTSELPIGAGVADTAKSVAKKALGAAKSTVKKAAKMIPSRKIPKPDIHKAIGYLPKPKAGWTPGKHKYLGPYNPLEEQVDYDKKTGKVKKWHVKPHNKGDEIAAHHDICYSIGRPKSECDKEMLSSLKGVKNKDKWTKLANLLIGAKYKLGVGLY